MNIHSIRWRLLAIMLTLVIALLATLTYVQILSQQTLLKKELAHRETLMREKTLLRGQSLSDNLANQVAIEIAAFNFSQVSELIHAAAKKDPDLAYGILMDADRLVQIHTQHPELELETLSAVEDKFAVKQAQPTRQILIKKGEEIVEFISPIQISTEPWGVLRLGFSMAKVAAEIAQSHKDIEEQIRGMIVKSVITAMIFLLGGFIIVFIISNRISKPLVELTHSARELAKGNFSAKMPVLVSSQDEVSVLASTFTNMAKNLERSHKQLAEHNLLLEQRVAERTAELNEMLDRMTKSIKYAQIIQSSLLPNMELVKTDLPNHFFIWMPRDIVGGDMLYTEPFKEGFIVALIDCTGHGVPGAFMTMVASTNLRQITRDEKCYDPGDILKRLNFLVQSSLQQDTDHARSDDGLDAAICWIKPQENSLIFAGAKLPLYYIYNDQLTVIAGDKQSLGYKNADLDFTFTTHTVKIESGMSFYLSTDGFLDQLGGAKRFPFGKKRFRKLLMENRHYAFDEQSERMQRAFYEYKGEHDRQDDVTVLGFGFEL